jgi:hypothetical protein
MFADAPLTGITDAMPGIDDNLLAILAGLCASM